MRVLSLVALMCLAAGPAATQTLSLPEGHELSSPERHPFSLSADGTRLVYLARTTVFVKPVGAGDPAVVSGPLQGRNKSNPLFTPDGQSIVYWATDGSVLERVPVGGGTPVTWARVDNPLGMSWTPDGQLLVGQGAKGIVRVSSAGVVETLVAMQPGESASSPQMLPDGEHVVFTLAQGTPANWVQGRIVVQSTRTQQRGELAQGHDARYVPTGHLVYVSEGRLVAAAFDAARRIVTGAPVELADAVPVSRDTGSAQFSVAPNGTLVYTDPRPAPLTTAWVTLDGLRTNIGELPDGGSAPRLAADGRTMIFRSQSTRAIYIADVSNIAGTRRVLSDAALPVISPDGQDIVIGSLGTSRRADGAEVLYLVRGDGTGEPELLANPGRAPEQWTQPDLFTFITYKEPQNYDLWVYSMSRRQAQPIAAEDGSAQLSGAFSPNGRWISYMSTEVGGQWQIFIQPYPTDGRKFQVTTAGGRSAAWASDSELIYDGDGRMYSVTVDFTGETPRFGKPRELPITGMIQPMLRRNWDITRVGGEPRLLMQFQAGPQLNVVPGWTARVQPTAGN